MGHNDPYISGRRRSSMAAASVRDLVDIWNSIQLNNFANVSANNVESDLIGLYRIGVSVAHAEARYQRLFADRLCASK